jgi:hypothetical protein
MAVLRTMAGPSGLALLATYSGCICSRGGLPPEARLDFGDTSAPPPDARACLATARAVLDGRTGAAVPALPPLPARRVMLALWRGGQASVATANGPTLADALASAAGSIAGKNAGGEVTAFGQPLQEGRLELDVPTSLEGATVDEDTELPLASIGLEGILVTRDDGKTGFVLPGEIVQLGYHRQRKLDHLAIMRLLAARAGVPEHDLATMRAYRFRADVHVESADHTSALPVLRGMVEPPVQVAADTLLAAVRRGADYLARILSSSGRYVYMYHPADDRNDSSYGWLRHAGTTYALFEAYGEFGTSSYLEKGELALRYLSANLSRDAASQGKYVVDTGDEEQQKVGGAALALLAFSKHAAVSGKRDSPEAVETMRALARFILKQQYEDGHFRSNVDVEYETGKKLKREPVYYPGEAVLALMRLYAIDPQRAYLDAARKGADWVIHARDAYVSEDNQEHDHWISYADNELYRVTQDEAYLNHAYKIARAIQRKQRRASGTLARDLVGTFYDGQSTPASTRVEAYDADIVLSRFAGKPEPWLTGPAEEAARSILGDQYDSNNDYWLKNPAKAEGGVRESLFVHDVRIDYVQHAMSAWLHLARILRDPNYGKSGVPSQDPVLRAPEEAAQRGIPASSP